MTINRILYAGPAWWGYADEADQTRIGLGSLFVAPWMSKDDDGY